MSVKAPAIDSPTHELPAHNLAASEADGWAACQSLALPLPTARQKFAEGDPFGDRYTRLLAAVGWELREIRVKYPRDSFFSRGTRAGWLQPADLSATVSPDDRYPRRQQCRLQFLLPRGSYATMLIKALQFSAPEAPES